MKRGYKFMKKGVILLTMVLILCLAGCSILPEDSPILLEGEKTETKGPAKNKDSKEESNSSEEEPTEEVREDIWALRRPTLLP